MENALPKRVEVGDIVLFVLDWGKRIGELRPAIVTRAHLAIDGHQNGQVDLTVFPVPGDGMKYNAVAVQAEAVPYNLDAQPGTWFFRLHS